jgi:hypothetical protein
VFRQGGWRQRIENIAQIFREKGATSAEKAITTQELGLSFRFEVAMRGRLGRSGIFVQVAEKGYYLDESRLQVLVRRPRASLYSGAASRKKKPIVDFDCVALFKAMDTKRISQGLSWPQVADEIWKMSSDLNDRRHDHPISPSTIIGMSKRGDTSCQHALFFLRWLGSSPESFLTESEAKLRTKVSLAKASSDERLRWDLHELYEEVNVRRQELQMTWPQLARVLHCTPSQLTVLRIVRFAIGMNLAMRIVQWLDRPAADFIYRAHW